MWEAVILNHRCGGGARLRVIVFEFGRPFCGIRIRNRDFVPLFLLTFTGGHQLFLEHVDVLILAFFFFFFIIIFIFIVLVVLIFRFLYTVSVSPG